MKILTFDSYQLMSAKVADLVMSLIIDKPNCVLALPTGKTPIGLYQELSEEVKQGELSLKEVVTFNLDDYVGIAKDHPASFYNYMKANLFSQVDLKPENIYMLDGTAPDLDWVCDDYERAIQEMGGLDMAILGVGLSGHLAYNEPGTPFDSRTHVVDLVESSRQSSATDFANKEDVPKQGVTMGLGTLMDAKQIILMARGAHKKDIIEKALHGPVSPDVPASILQQHPNVIVLLDKEAAG